VINCAILSGSCATIIEFNAFLNASIVGFCVYHCNPTCISAVIPRNKEIHAIIIFLAAGKGY
jgi:hypothetical protein